MNPATPEPSTGGASPEQQFIKLLNRAVSARGRGGPSGTDDYADTKTERALHSSLSALLAVHGEVCLQLHGDRLECHGTVVQTQEIDALALPLARQGLRSITFEEAAGIATVEGLLEVLSGGVGRADDTVSLLWKRGLPALRYEAELEELLATSAAGEDIERKANDILQTLSDTAGKAGTVKPPPAPPDLVGELLVEEVAKAGSLRADALDAVQAALRHPDAVHHLSSDDVRRLLTSAIEGLANSKSVRELGQLSEWLRVLLKGEEGVANPFQDAVRAVAERALEDERLRRTESGEGRTISDIVWGGLGDEAGALLAARFQVGRGDAAARTLKAWLERDLTAARTALVKRLVMGMDDKTAAALVGVMLETPQLYGEATRDAMVRLASKQPTLRLQVMEALAIQADCGASMEIWDWVEAFDLPQGPAAIRKRVLEILPLLVWEEPAMAYLDAVLAAWSLFAREAQVGMQLAVVRALGEYGTLPAMAVLRKHREHRSKMVRAAVEKALRKAA